MADILADVRQRGDAAVLDYTSRFDALEAASLADLELTQAELKAAFDGLPAAQRDALQAAARRVRSYHEAQKKASGESWSYRDEDGTLLGQKVTPLDRVGIYVPGGKAAYPSSVLMNAIPAHVAGVARNHHGGAHAARRKERAGAGRRLRGRRHAARSPSAARRPSPRWPTAPQTVPRVDKITGPGNAYVASAKRRVFGQVGIDMIAGPSEILVLADGTTPPDWVAMDLFSQAEHDELAQSILLCPDAAYIDQVQAEIDRLLPEMPRARDHRQVAQRPGRPDPHPQHGRGLRDQQPHRAGAPGDRQQRAAPLGAAAQARRARSSWAPSPANRWATTAPAPTTCCRPAARRAFPARWACTTSRSAAA